MMTDEDIDAIRMSLPPSASHFVFARSIEAAVRKTCEVACAQALLHARATERERWSGLVREFADFLEPMRFDRPTDDAKAAELDERARALLEDATERT